MDPTPLFKGAEILGEAMERGHLSKVVQGEEELGLRDAKYVYRHIDKWGDNDGQVELEDVGDIIQGAFQFLGNLFGG